MKIHRSIGVILVLLGFIFFTNKYIDNKSVSEMDSFSKNNDNVLIANMEEDVKDQKDKYVTYVNKSNHSITLAESDIKVTCHGSGEYKDDDEKLVKDNLAVSVLYSKDKKNKTKSIQLNKDEMVYIYVNAFYKGKVNPNKEVNCDYSINIQSAI